tara:strand:+ start:288 stop:569 length:282 start_codon:yes stop_codon:yes gene_type:complete
MSTVEAGVLQQLEISGMLAAFLIVAYGLYKLIILKGLNSKCGLVSVDLRSASTKQKELEYEHDIELKKLEVEIERIKHTVNINNDESGRKVTE